jgi:multidrug efflux pump subunit AcrA (membrane-fusion protein)
VKIEVTSKSKSLLKPQMTANVDIIEASKKDVVLVPSLAVFRKDHKEMVTVVKADGTTEDRSVEAGINDGNNQEIVSGLTPGETILVHKNDSSSRWTAQGNRPLTGVPGGRR